jgi:hypothetical protein
MNRLMWILTLFLLCAVAVGVILFLTLEDPIQRIAEAVGIYSVEKHSETRALLKEIRAVGELSTVRYEHQTVFPFDFMAESVDRATIYRKLEEETGTVASILSPTELVYFDAYNLARDLGLSTGPQEYQFLVVPVIVTAGFDLREAGLANDPPASQPAWSEPASSDAQSSGPEPQVRVEDGTVSLRLPQPVITGVEVRDVRSEDYRFPDVPIAPDDWRRIADFVSEHIRHRSVERGIFERARRNTEQFLTAFLQDAGYDSVHIAWIETSE